MKALIFVAVLGLSSVSVVKADNNSNLTHEASLRFGWRCIARCRP